EPSSTPLPAAAAAGGSPLVTAVQSVRLPTPGTATASDVAPAGTPAPTPIAGSAGRATAAFSPAPVMSPSDDSGLRISGAPESAPLADAESWPLEVPLREFFPPAPEGQRAVRIVPEPEALPLRELGASHGLGVGLPPAHLQVEDEAGDQYAIVLWEE
ncbi:MAG TPA: hypothetical protein VMG12_33160, partial [Polyangiaceae bacterium]|nr:hypothetical protein [Polyangiaceae bacterium]